MYWLRPFINLGYLYQCTDYSFYVTVQVDKQLLGKPYSLKYDAHDRITNLTIIWSDRETVCNMYTRYKSDSTTVTTLYHKTIWCNGNFKIFDFEDVNGPVEMFMIRARFDNHESEMIYDSNWNLLEVSYWSKTIDFRYVNTGKQIIMSAANIAFVITPDYQFIPLGSTLLPDLNRSSIRQFPLGIFSWLIDFTRPIRDIRSDLAELNSDELDSNICFYYLVRSPEPTKKQIVKRLIAE